MRARLAMAALAALLATATAADAADVGFGNPSGCAAFREDWDKSSDLMLLVRPGEIAQWETSCTLPAGDFDGTETVATCSGEGEDWTITVSLTVPESRPDVMIYVEVDPKTGRSTRTEELWRCP